ncbi:uncharacterized protein LOC126560673 [Anopheles maculipalpis]|uniref:uncharacterized protein LOC126560673 n=1 Tax=Anopheles maculipalpis TaxID=1496333 RepID=UPI00215949AF|nr:uncharacterized protein LOC126560673 [Anopheles maculipalpis]
MKIALIVVACLVATVVSAPTQISLTDDFDDFVALLPLDDLLDLAMRYLLTDKEVQQALLYLQGAEFASVWDQFFALTAVRDLLNYLEDAGVPAYDSLNEVADFLGLTHLKPGVRSLRTGGLNGLLEEALALLPHDELEALFEEKLKTSAEFKALFEKLQKFDHKQLRDLYENSAEVQGMVQKLRDHGVDVDHIVQVVKDFFELLTDGHLKWCDNIIYKQRLSTSDYKVSSYKKDRKTLLKLSVHTVIPNRTVTMKIALIVVACLVATVVSAPTQISLTDDFDDFVALLPLDDLLDLALRYLLTDKEVQQALLYLQGAEFASVWDQFFALTAVRDLLNYLEDAGVPAYDSLNEVADFLGLTHLKPGVRSLRTGGLNGLLEEALALLPHDELEALFEEKLKTSPEFKALFEKLQKFDHKQLRDLYENSAEVQGMVQKLRDHGVDVDHIVQVVKDFFVIPNRTVTMKIALIVVACLVATVVSAPTQISLTDDFDDFVALLPLDDLLDLALRYLLTDKEVQQALLYLQGAEFASVWDQFFALTAVRDLLNYLEDAGVPAYDSLNEVADFLGLTHLKPGVRSLRTGGLNGLLEEALALLPHDELEALFEEKLKTSPEFKALFEKLQKFDHKQLRDLYENSAEVQGMVQKLRDHGVDVDHIVQVVKDFFGWN